MKKNKIASIKGYFVREDYYINIDLDNSVLYDKRIIWTNEFKNSPVELFIDKHYNEIIKNLSAIHKEIIKTAFNNLLCNLVWGLEQQKLIAIPLSKKAFQLPRMYGLKHFRYNYIVRTLQRLIEYGYVNFKKGFIYENTGKGKVSRIWASEKLIRELNELSIQSISLTTNINDYFSDKNVSIASEQFSNVFYHTPVILKDAKKNIISYIPTAITDEMVKFLNYYNDFISSQNIIYPSNGGINSKSNSNVSNLTQTTVSNTNYYSPLLGENDIQYIFYTKLDCRLHRVFNNQRFDEGGRFYGAKYQHKNESERELILINGNRVVEIDYSAIHGRMVYNYVLKKEYLADPYLIRNNLEIRDASKVMFMMMINAKGRKRAIEAFKKFLREDDDGKKINKILLRNKITPTEIYSELAEKHKEIKEYFSTGIGIKLQFIDSTIAENILKHFTYKNIPCLCIHDSFIVEKKYADELADVMRKEYKKIIGFDCVLKNWEGK